jgi:cysteine synthase A
LGVPVARLALPASDPFAAFAEVQIHDAIRDTARHDAIRAEIVRLNATTPISGVMTADEKSVTLTAQLAADLGLPGITVTAAHAARDKVTMRATLDRAGVGVPRWLAVRNGDEARDAAAAIGYPVVVKPADNAASCGVQIVRETSGLAPSFDYALGFSTSGDVLVEQFMEGPEVTVDAISDAGSIHIVAICGKDISDPPFFVELGHWFPSELPANELDRIRTEVEKALVALGITHGASHTEVRLTASGPVIIEAAARLGGDQIPELVRLASGIDLYAAAIEVALGRDPTASLTKTKDGAAGCRMLVAPPGVIARVPDVVSLATMDVVAGLVEVHLDGVLGQPVGPLRHNGNTLGWVTVEGESPGQVKERLDAVVGASVYVTHP